MAREIERKFLIREDSWRQSVGDVIAIRQFYLGRRDDFSVRIRIVDAAKAYLTVKTGAGLSRGEFEYEIPLADAHDLEPARIGRVISKKRHRLPLGRHVIEVDVFEDDLAPLVIAEIELRSEDDAVELPSFLGQEVTGDSAYSNARLALSGHPDTSSSL
ncbi:adenylate cyclase [Aureimonas sp. SA4125]|uniref:CYTH domain-containing protein n=1 Tax=Aureimonas sp. SA4125 TaxID=2826993 RepID=UPI001CC812DC|nr:CYTH domain-containing protein [Aureimonas sp. SA4125]BDA86385.1 adenylate cyclase [Aureimonas sp. SA4125]